MGSCFSTPTTATQTQVVSASILKPLSRSPKFAGKRPSFYSSYARAANRYGFQTTKYAPFKKTGKNTIVHVRANGESGDVPAESVQNDAEYIVAVQIGTPGVTLHLDFDTGSSDLWVWSTELTGVSKSGHGVYNPAKSSTSKQQSGSTWNISYGDGSSASGNVYADTVTIGNVSVPGQAVELAEKLSSQFASGEGSDGLLGLAWPSINTVSPKAVKTPVENMIDQKLISQPLFTVKLDRGDNAGFYSFGEIDTTVTSNPITYTSVDNSQGFWMVPSASYKLNGKTIKRSGNQAILDTGTTLALVDDATVSKIYGAIKGAKYDQNQGGWLYPSSATVPTVAFAVGDTLYNINAEDFPYGPADDGWMFGGIQSRGSLTFDILGDVFLKNVYVVFNQGESTVGLAQRDD